MVFTCYQLPQCHGAHISVAPMPWRSNIGCPNAMVLTYRLPQCHGAQVLSVDASMPWCSHVIGCHNAMVLMCCQLIPQLFHGVHVASVAPMPWYSDGASCPNAMMLTYHLLKCQYIRCPNDIVLTWYRLPHSHMHGAHVL